MTWGFVLTVEARLREELRNYAVELRQLAYTLPSGVGENDLLRLSDRMRYCRPSDPRCDHLTPRLKHGIRTRAPVSGFRR